MYYVYVLKSKKDNRLYVGHTQDLKKRIPQHNSGEVTATKNQRPLELLYYEACNILYDAITREKSLKTGFGRAYLKRHLGDL
jgi:putative endonuclease